MCETTKVQAVTAVELRDEQGHLQAVLVGAQLEIRRAGVVTIYDLRRGKRVASRRDPRPKRGRRERGRA